MGLGHLFDCLIFPQKGDRPHTDEASGSDMYFVSWDKDLVPPINRSWVPMEYTAEKARELDHEVKQTDIIEFFANNMVNTSLGTICNAHVVHADLSAYGALNKDCLKLAELAAIAVDFPKTGCIVSMPHSLKPKQYPDFMGKEEFQSYKSHKILGKLYRQIKDLSVTDVTSGLEHEILPSSIPYDKDFEVADAASFLEDAFECKLSYGRQLNGLLGQYRVDREEEIVTGHIWSMPNDGGKKQGEMKDRVKHAYSALRKDFRKMFDDFGAEFENVSKDERNVIFEKKASAWYQVVYHPLYVKKALELQEHDRKGEKVNLSFAWIAADYLERIKNKCRER